MKTPGEPAQHRGARTAGEKCPGAHGNREGAGRAPYEIGQNVLFLLAARAPEWICDLGFRVCLSARLTF